MKIFMLSALISCAAISVSLIASKAVSLRHGARYDDTIGYQHGGHGFDVRRSYSSTDIARDSLGMPYVPAHFLENASGGFGYEPAHTSSIGQLRGQYLLGLIAAVRAIILQRLPEINPKRLHRYQ